MRLALGSAPVTILEALSWQLVGPGFEVAEMPALVDGRTVDTLLLAISITGKMPVPLPP